MVTTSVTYLDSLERCFVAHGEVVGVTHKGSDQAALHSRRACRGVRSQQAYDAKGPERSFGDGGAFALHTWSWGRVLPAAGRQEALPFIDRGRGARLDRLLRSPTQVPCAPLLDPESLCRDQAASRPAQGGRGGARQAQEARIRGRAGARLRGPAPRRAASGGARWDTPEGYLRLDQVGNHRAGDLPLRPVRLARVLVLRLLRPQKGDERPDEGGSIPLGREGRGLRTTTGALRPGLDEHCAGGVQRAALGEGPGHRAGEEELRAHVPLRQDHTRGGRRRRGGNPALGDRLLRFAPIEPREGHLRRLPAGAGRGPRKQGPRDRTSLPAPNLIASGREEVRKLVARPDAPSLPATSRDPKRTVRDEFCNVLQVPNWYEIRTQYPKHETT